MWSSEVEICLIKIEITHLQKRGHRASDNSKTFQQKHFLSTLYDQNQQLLLIKWEMVPISAVDDFADAVNFFRHIRCIMARYEYE